MPHHRSNAPKYAMATLALILAAHAEAQTEITLPLPPSIEVGQCRPLNISTGEMEKQWDLHYRFAKRMQRNPALVEEERKSLTARAMMPESIECFAGREVFAALCFSVARTKSLDIRAIKLMHASSGADCLSLTNVVKR
jgi:hypothetical protein